MELVCQNAWAVIRTSACLPVDECLFFGTLDQIYDPALSMPLGWQWYLRDSWWLVVDPNLEPSRAPIHKLDALLTLDMGNCCIDIFWYNIPPVE